VQELYVFDLQVLELLMDAPGLNDAMYLYGTLRGPYPAAEGATLKTIEGQLTVTRSDLLGGLIEGTADAFAYQPDANGARCVHALLPGERADLIDGGRGVVLALPIAPAWTLESSVSNDRVAAQIIHDVLGALRRDLGDATPLPVANRAAVIAELKAQGFTIEGDEAVKTTKSGLLGIRTEREKKPVPREAPLEEFVRLALSALPKIGPPSPESFALRRRHIGRESRLALVDRAGTTPAHVARPMSSDPISSTSPTSRAPRPQVKAQPTDWMKDFVDAHQAQGHAKPRVVAPARFVAPPPPPKPKQSWMDDFDEPKGEPAEQAGPKSDTGEPSSKKPDWSKDFE
jgi:hypothetical protein